MSRTLLAITLLASSNVLAGCGTSTQVAIENDFYDQSVTVKLGDETFSSIESNSKSNYIEMPTGWTNLTYVEPETVAVDSAEIPVEIKDCKQTIRLSDHSSKCD